MLCLGIDQHKRPWTVNLRAEDGTVILMRGWYKRIKKRRGSKIGRVAVMRRMVTIIWHMLKKKQKYRYESPIKKHQEFVAFEGESEAT